MEAKSIHAHHIPASNGVDPIDVFVVWYGEQAFQVTIRCWDCAWTAYRGSCGFKTIEEYFLEQWYSQECHEHVVQLFTTTSRHTTQKEEKWLFKVVRSMCQHFKQLAEKNEVGDGVD